MGTSDPLVVFKITILQVNCVTIHEAYHQNSLSASMQVLQLELQSAHLRTLRSTRGCLLSVCFVRPGVLFPKEVFTIELTKITGGSPVVPNSFEKTDERRSSSFLLWVHGRSGARGCMLSVALLRPGILEIHRTPFTYIYI